MFLRYPVPPGDTVWLTCCWLDPIVRWLQLTLPHSSHGNSAEDAILLLNELAWHKAQCMQDLLTPDFLISIFYPLHPDQLVLSLSGPCHWKGPTGRGQKTIKTPYARHNCAPRAYTADGLLPWGHVLPILRSQGTLSYCASVFFFTMNLPKVVVQKTISGSWEGIFLKDYAFYLSFAEVNNLIKLILVRKSSLVLCKTVFKSLIGMFWISYGNTNQTLKTQLKSGFIV